MNTAECSFELHGAAIRDIVNDAIAHSTAIYEYHPRSLESVKAWFDAKRAGAFPVIGAEEDGNLLGFATYGLFRAFPAFKYTVEHSVYIHENYQGKGVGRILLQELIERAKDQEYHVLVGAIDLENEASLSLHRALGFEHAGTIKQAGFKFGRGLDLALCQLVLPTPISPAEG